MKREYNQKREKHTLKEDYFKQNMDYKKASCTDIRRFAEFVSCAVSEELGDGYQVKLQEIIKNNGVVLQGLIILNGNSNLSPTIYLNSFLEAYENDMPMTDIVHRILDIYRRELPVDNIDMNFFRDFEKVRDRICYRVINRERNRALLERIPHVDYLDLSICFFYSYRNEALGDGSILIYNNHAEAWKCSVSMLMQLARENTKRLYPTKLINMEEILESLIGRPNRACCMELPMYVLSNEQKVFGAGAMLCREVLQKTAKLLQEDFYILPSSVHEVIVLPVSAAGERQSMREMVREINSTQVAPEEVLSDNLYFYSRLEGCLTLLNV